MEKGKAAMSTGPYSAKVMEHFMNPRNVGEIPDADGVGTVGNPVCGDIMKMFIKVVLPALFDPKTPVISPFRHFMLRLLIASAKRTVRVNIIWNGLRKTVDY